jgi:tryptophan halogenase
MKNTINKIIIVGGGSAGWMTAATLSHEFPDKEIALVESPDVPIIGVGESTLGTINQYLGLLGLEDKDWMEYCNATYKLSIKFTDFYERGQEFYYPFGVKDMQNCQQGIADWYVKKTLNPETPSLDFYESFYSSMPFILNSKIYDNADGQLPGFSFKNDAAYHMDATLFGEFLRERYCEPRGVVHIKEHISEVLLNEEGEVHALVLGNGDSIEADLYIDCSGFRALLIEGAMKVNFTSFENILPNNRAWAVQVPYEDKELEMENTTDCVAIDNGWVWNIPLYNRIGKGYVFSSKFVSEDDALEEFKQFIMSRMKVKRTREQVDALEFRLIKIKNGVHDRCWHKNVVAVGLSYGFIEPLESTGLLSVQEILLKLCSTLHFKTTNKIHIDNFNHVVSGIMHSFKYFVAYHFTLSSRRDTPYWKHVTENIEMESEMLLPGDPKSRTQVGELAARLIQQHHIPGDFSMGGIPDIFVGMNTLPVNPTQLKIMNQILLGRNGSAPEFFNNQTQDYWNQKKEYINGLASTAPSHYQYLKENIYNNKE